MLTRFEVRDGLGQVNGFDSREDADRFASDRRKFTWAEVHQNGY